MEKEWVEECLWALYRINEMMDLLSDNPKLGISPLLGHPVIASACLATCKKLLKPT
jgi:hypothetical protein